MQLEHAFTVEAPVETVYAALLDPHRVAPCMPGATLVSVDGTTFTGKVKVKLGPVSLQYKGTGEYTGTDESARTVVIEASGKDAKGNGTAAATVTLTLTADGARTAGTSSTDLTVTGKPAQFGRGMISDVGGKILEQFASNLSTELGGGAGPDTPPGSDSATGTGTQQDASAAATQRTAPSEGAPTAASEPRSGSGTPSTAPRPAAEAEPLDLGQYAGGAVIKRALPLAGVGALAALVLILILRGRGGGARDD